MTLAEIQKSLNKTESVTETLDAIEAISGKDVRWTYDLVHSQMHYKGLSLDEACKSVEATFDGTQPKGLFEAVKRYHDFRASK